MSHQSQYYFIVWHTRTQIDHSSWMSVHFAINLQNPRSLRFLASTQNRHKIYIENNIKRVCKRETKNHAARWVIIIYLCRSAILESVHPCKNCGRHWAHWTKITPFNKVPFWEVASMLSSMTTSIILRQQGGIRWPAPPPAGEGGAAEWWRWSHSSSAYGTRSNPHTLHLLHPSSTVVSPPGSSVDGWGANPQSLLLVPYALLLCNHRHHIIYLIQCELEEGEHSRSSFGVAWNLGGFGGIDGFF